MQISENGLRKIEGYEGYGRALPDGRCAAYQDTYHGKLDKPTIGFGCTEGVEIGMVWTRAEADAAFMRELTKHEAAVQRLVTVDITQNEFDALTSFSYNCGIGALTKSSILKRLNAGDRNGAADAFALYNKAGGGVVQGLVQRRASEASLCLKPVDAPERPAMPQSVEASAHPVSRKAIATATAVAVTAAPALPLPAVPPSITESVINATAWKALGEQLWMFKSYAVSEPLVSGGLALSVLMLWFWPRKG